MKETIRYYYNIYPNKIEMIDNGCYFYFNGIKYYFIKTNRTKEEIDFLVKISNDLYNNNILVDTFVKNKDNLFYVINLEDVYVMLRVNSLESNEYTIQDTILFNNSLISNNVRSLSSDWATLWMKKIDDYETEISEFNTDYPIIQSTFDYYVGLAENAVSYFIDSFNEEDVSTSRVTINHKRVNSKIYTGQIYNPLTFTFDYEVRDLAEYIKSSFFDNELDYDEIEKVIRNNNFSRCSLRFLYSRLLYPSYYFDMLEKIIVENEDESKLNIYIERIEDYQDMLTNMYDIINRITNIPIIQWLFDNYE